MIKMNLFQEIKAAAGLGNKNKGITFNDIIGYEEIKDILQRALENNIPINMLFNGVAGSAKTMFMKAIKEICGDKAFYVNCITSSVQKFLADLNRVQKKKNVLIIDEIDKWTKSGHEKLLTLLEDGEVFVNYKSYDPFWIRIPNLKVFAAGNSTVKLLKPLKSRFLVYDFPEYTEEEYRQIITFKLREAMIKDDIIETIITHKLETEDKDPRKAIELVGLLKRNDTPESVKKLLRAQEKYRSTEDINYN